MDRERELWAIALLIEKRHGDDGADYILDRIAQLDGEGGVGGTELWSQIYDRFLKLRPPGVDFDES